MAEVRGPRQTSDGGGQRAELLQTDIPNIFSRGGAEIAEVYFGVGAASAWNPKANSAPSLHLGALCDQNQLSPRSPRLRVKLRDESGPSASDGPTDRIASGRLGLALRLK
jgi:hypothetical protein